MTPTTEQLKDLLAKVTPDWMEDGMTGDDPRMCGNLLRVKTSDFQSIFVAAWLDDENDAAEARANATLIALAPALAAEVVRLREALAGALDTMLFAQAEIKAQAHIPHDDEEMMQDRIDRARQALDATSAK